MSKEVFACCNKEHRAVGQFAVAIGKDSPTPEHIKRAMFGREDKNFKINEPIYKFERVFQDEHVFALVILAIAVAALIILR